MFFSLHGSWPYKSCCGPLIGWKVTATALKVQHCWTLKTTVGDCWRQSPTCAGDSRQLKYKHTRDCRRLSPSRATVGDWSINQALESQQTPHTSPSGASYGVSLVRILEKIDRVITALHCICHHWHPKWLGTMSSHVWIHMMNKCIVEHLKSNLIAKLHVMVKENI